ARRGLRLARSIQPRVPRCRRDDAERMAKCHGAGLRIGVVFANKIRVRFPFSDRRLAMKTPLVAINIPSIYPENRSSKVPLPKRLARCTTDMKLALHRTAIDLADAGGKLRLSDLFRSYDMQLASHMDFVAKRKKAYSP